MSRDRVVGGHPKAHIWNQRPQFAYSLYNFYGVQRRLRGVYIGAPHCKAVLSRKSPVKSGPQMAVFRVLRGLNFFLTPKTHSLAQNRVVWRIIRDNRFGGLGYGASEERQKRSRVNIFDSQIRTYVEKKPLIIMTKFCTWVYIQDPIKYATFFVTID